VVEAPPDPLGFIQRCVRERKLFWTYHVNMRLERRHITRDEIISGVDSFEIIEAYPDDKYREWEGDLRTRRIRR
jgi:hypothetical protein